MVLTPVTDYSTALTPSLVADVLDDYDAVEVVAGQLRRSVLVFRWASRTAVQMQLLCRMEAAAVVESGAAVVFVDRGEARSPDQSPLWHTAVL